MSDNTPLPGPTALMTINTVLVALTAVSAIEAKMAEAMGNFKDWSSVGGNEIPSGMSETSFQFLSMQNAQGAIG